MTRRVCDIVLDKSVPKDIRFSRAQALLMLGKIFQEAKREPGEGGQDAYIFEELVASSQKKVKPTRQPPDRSPLPQQEKEWEQ